METTCQIIQLSDYQNKPEPPTTPSGGAAVIPFPLLEVA